jgi:hypothetical protein
MFRLQLRVIVCKLSKHYFQLQPAHSYSDWAPKMNLLLGYMYKIICSLFRINQCQDFCRHNKNFNIRSLILINSG